MASRWSASICLVERFELGVECFHLGVERLHVDVHRLELRVVRFHLFVDLLLNLLVGSVFDVEFQVLEGLVHGLELFVHGSHVDVHGLDLRR